MVFRIYVCAALLLLLPASATQADNKPDTAPNSEQQSAPIPAICFQAQEAAEPERAVELWTECLDAGLSEQVMGVALYNRGRQHMAQGKAQAAIEDYTKAAKHIPTDPDVYINRGYAYQHQGALEKAEGDFSRAIALNPSDPMGYANRASARTGLTHYDSAVYDYEQAIGKDPMHIPALQGLALLLATCEDKTIRNGIEAVQVALRLVTLQRSADTLDTLAAAHAQAEQFPQAVTVQKEAIALAQEAGESTFQYEKNLKRYEQDRTY